MSTQDVVSLVAGCHVLVMSGFCVALLRRRPK